MPTHASNDYTQQIFKKPIIRINSYYLALIYYYQNSNKWQIRHDFSTTLLKKASPILSDDLQSFYMKIISKIRTWYLAESKSLTVDPSQKKMESFFTGLFSELGLDRNDVLPFSSKTIDWTEYKE
jgi:hypothetical protein